MFDPGRFVALVRGGFLETEETAAAYRAEDHPWRDTAANLTAPMILASMVVAGLVAWLLSSGQAYGSFGYWLLATILGAAQFALAVVIFTVMAGALGGVRDFDRGTAALSIAAIPGWVGNALGTLPWLGWLVSLALGVWSLVCLYRILPGYLEVPESKRVLHFVLSLLIAAVASALVAVIFGVKAYEDATEARVGVRPPGVTEGDPGEPRGGGFVGEVQRTAAIYDSAMADTFEPPADGRLERRQVEEYVRVMTRARAMQDEYAARMEALSEELENKEDASFSDLMKLYRGIGGAISSGNAAMEIVKTSGGNWAEHVWVEEQLRVARFQPDAGDAARRNRALYDEFADQLEAIDAF